ncbi:MAG: NAD-dependent epimerase/dehydratase family protein [Chloroflexi bacterium]|nr:NAD-dependent epimerase/dehydratase family protein [Chloroflexota bacterium]
MRVLITGGAGFLGTHLAQRLLRRGDTVGIFDGVVSYDAVGSLAGKVSVVQGDLTDRRLVFSVVANFRPQSIFHLGALLPPATEVDPVLAIQTNIAGTQHVLDAAADSGVAQVVFTSTIATFGRGVTSPVPNEAPQLPVSVYGATKAAAERLGEIAYQRTRRDFRGVRFPSVIGPGRTVSGLGAYVHHMLAAGAAGRPWTVPVAPESRSEVLPVEEATRALLAVHDAAPEGLRYRMYNIAGLRPSAAEVAAALARARPEAQFSFHPDPQMTAWLEERLYLDDRAARTDWGWAPAHDLDALVASYLADAARTGGDIPR